MQIRVPVAELIANLTDSAVYLSIVCRNDRAMKGRDSLQAC